MRSRREFFAALRTLYASLFGEPLLGKGSRLSIRYKRHTVQDRFMASSERMTMYGGGRGGSSTLIRYNALNASMTKIDWRKGTPLGTITKVVESSNGLDITVYIDELPKGVV
jgi:hypothetical protein